MTKKTGINIKNMIPKESHKLATLTNKNKNVINIKINADAAKRPRKKRQYKRKPKPSDDKGHQSYAMQPPTVIYQSQPLYQQPSYPAPVAIRSQGEPISSLSERIRETQPVPVIEPQPAAVGEHQPLTRQEMNALRKRILTREPATIREPTIAKSTLTESATEPDFENIGNRIPEPHPFSYSGDTVATQLNPLSERMRPEARRSLKQYFKEIGKAKTPAQIEQERLLKNAKAREKRREIAKTLKEAENLRKKVDVNYNQAHPEGSPIIRTDATTL